MKIVSVSRRTDIPAFYPRWFMNRVRAGFCHWQNPYGGQVYRVSLRPEDCLALVFWTRNPRPLLPYLSELRAMGHAFYMHMSINGYSRAIETNNPPLATAIDAFRRVSDLLSPALTHWRYDPIVVSDATPFAYHLERFDTISRALAGATERCYFSFVDFYGKTSRNLARVERAEGIRFTDPPSEERRRLAHALRDIAASRGITLYACCEAGLVGDGVAASHCIDLDTVRRLRPDADAQLRAAPTRAECGCVETADIGAYDTCLFGCAYCYATNSRAAARARRAVHDPDDTILFRPASLRGIDLATREFVPKSERRNRTVVPLLPLL